MSDQNRYPRRDRRDEEDEGFIDRVKDWFGLRNESERRDRYYHDRPDRDRPGYQQAGSRRYNQDRVRVYDTRDRDLGYSNYGRDYSSGRERSGYRYNFDRNLGRDYGRSYDYNRETRYSQDPYDRDWEYGLGEDYRNEYDRNYGYGRGYRSRPGYPQSRGQDYRRDFERERDYASNRDYDRNHDYGRDRDYDRTYDRGGWSYDEDYGDRYNNRPGNRFSSRRDYGRGQSEWDRSYPAAGMRSDYAGYGYQENDTEDVWDDESMYPDYVGYDSEGAFYQDLDNPYTSDYWEVWMVPGQYTGMGPQNYNRSDERIMEEVCERLSRHGRIDASDIDVNVENGDVTLRGSVPSRDMKRMAEDAADSVSGVNDIRNEIKVSQRDWQGRGRRDNRDQIGAGFYGWSESGMPAYDSRLPGESERSFSERDTSEQNWVANQGGPVSERARLELRPGMEVIDQSGKVIGTVKQIRASDFLVDRELARDVFVPFDVVQSVGAQVMVNVAKDEVDNQGWQNP